MHSYKRAAGLLALIVVPFLAAVAVAGGAAPATGQAPALTPTLLPRDDLRAEAKAFIARERARARRSLLKHGVVPVRGPVDYGTETNGFGAQRSGHVHNGQDMFAPTGTPLVAVRKAVVVEAGSDGGRGNYLVLYSRAARQSYVYFHMLRRARVRPGQRVGALGCSGSCDGAHLHFEVHRGRNASGRGIDPRPLLRRWHHLARR